MKIPVSELLVRYMEHLGIEYIFGIPGAHILPVYDSLFASNIKSVLVKHEQGAAFMAGGYARASGKIAACITTAGPGATNLVTGIANAFADKLPILIITGETSTHIFGKGGLQESSGEGGSIDQAALFKGLTRYSRIVERTDYLVHVLNQTSKILLSNNSGPVLLSFPFNVQKEMVDSNLLEQVITCHKAHSPAPRAHAVDALLALLDKAQCPVIVAGYGCTRAQEALLQFCTRLSIPVTTSLKGMGVISDAATLSLGNLGVTSNGNALRYIVDHADMLIFLGAGFNERTSYLWDEQILANKKLVQIDHDPEQLEKVFKADVAILADIHVALTEILNKVEKNRMLAKNLDGFLDFSKKLRQHTAERHSIVSHSQFTLIENFFTRLDAHFSEGALIFDDNIVFAQNFFKVSGGNRYFPNSGISSLGHAIPAAIGARFVEHKPTFAILGDGGFQMCCMEIMTAVNYAIPLNVVVFNNATMGLIRKTQHQSYGQRYIDCDFINPDFHFLAKSFGIAHLRVDAISDLDTLFTRYDLVNAINLIEIIIDKNAFPNYVSRR
jgi:acetolactate synthase-1/2/3 large subunit